jgi:hypothetical protein
MAEKANRSVFFTRVGQGLLLGAVLLIPVIVWANVRHLLNQPEEVQAVEPAQPVAPKRKLDVRASAKRVVPKTVAAKPKEAPVVAGDVERVHLKFKPEGDNVIVAKPTAPAAASVQSPE